MIIITKTNTMPFWVISYILFFLLVGSNLPSPLYSVYQNLFGFSSIVLTFIFAIYAFALIPSLWLFGQLSDHIGRKKILITGTLITIIGSLIFSLAKGTGWLITARALQGIAAGMISGTATATLIELHPTRNKRRASLVGTIATAGGTAIGPILSGLLAQYDSTSITLPYIVHLLFFIPGLVALISIPETVKPISLKHWNIKFPKVSNDIRFVFMIGAITGFITWSVSAFYTSLIPSYINDLMDIDEMTLTGGFVFIMLMVSALTQLILREISIQKSMISGLICLVTGLFGVLYSVPTQSLLVLLVSTVIIGFGWGLAYMGSLELVNQIAPSNERAHVISTFYIVVYLGVGIPVIGIGLGAEIFDLYQSVILYVSIASILALIVIIVIYINSKKLINNTHNP